MIKVQSIIDELNGQKEQFLTDVEKDINLFIAQKSWQECLTIVQRYPSGHIKSIWKPSIAGIEYTVVLIKFLRKKKLDGYELDSNLTDDIVSIVTQKFSDFYTSNSDAFAKSLLNQLLTDKVFVNQLANHIVEVSQDELPDAVKAQMTKYLIHMLEDSCNINISQIASSTIPTLMKGILAGASALPISQAIVVVLINHMAIFLKGAIAKIMAMTGVKTFIITIIKKLVATKIIAVLIAMVGSSLGAVPVGYIVLPLLIAFIVHQVDKLPEKMGKNVSEAIKNELSGEFKNINANIVELIMKNLVMHTTSVLAMDIAKDTSFIQIMKEISRDDMGK